MFGMTVKYSVYCLGVGQFVSPDALFFLLGYFHLVTMMRRSLLITVVLAVGFLGCDSDALTSESITAISPEHSVASKGAVARDDGLIHWSDLSDEDLWSHIASLDSTVLIGLKEPGQRRGVDERGRPLLGERVWRGIAESFEGQGMELQYVDNIQPLAQVKLDGQGELEALRRSPFVSYVEPARFEGGEIWQASSSCGASNIYDYGGAINPGDVVPWTLEKHDVPRAWGLSTGDGVTIGFVDTGTSALQPQLNGEFSSGLSTGRSITNSYSSTNYLSPFPWHDSCGHGTKLIGIAAAPRDGQSMVGIAYRANVHSVRVGSNVDFGPGTYVDVMHGISMASVSSDIVNISIGSVYYYQSVADGIRYFYHDPAYRTLYIGAAGTSPFAIGDGEDGVIFPASLDEVVATTGLEHTNRPCDGCWRGPKVELSAYVFGETLDIEGSSLVGAGGSSGSTAIISGIAALIWSRYPNWTREQVVARLREAALRSEKKDGTGYGPPNAYRALGGMSMVRVNGPGEILQSGQTYTWTVQRFGGTGPFSYSWSPQGSSESLTYTVPDIGEPYTIGVQVRVIDQYDGNEEVDTIWHQVWHGTQNPCPGGEILC